MPHAFVWGFSIFMHPFGIVSRCVAGIGILVLRSALWGLLSLHNRNSRATIYLLKEKKKKKRKKSLEEVFCL